MEPIAPPQPTHNKALKELDIMRTYLMAGVMPYFQWIVEYADFGFPDAMCKMEIAKRKGFYIINMLVSGRLAHGLSG